MAKLPDRNILNGNKNPKTTTGEMKDALGKLRDYLNELLGEDSADKEGARQALGIDLASLAEKIDAKADHQAIADAIQTKVDRTELANEMAEKVPYNDFLNQSLGLPGYQNLPGGLLFQWSRYTTGSDGRITVTWPRAFSEVFYLDASLTGGHIASGAYVHVNLTMTTVEVITTTPVGTGVSRSGRVFGIGLKA